MSTIENTELYGPHANEIFPIFDVPLDEKRAAMLIDQMPLLISRGELKVRAVPQGERLPYRTGIYPLNGEFRGGIGSGSFTQDNIPSHNITGEGRQEVRIQGNLNLFKQIPKTGRRAFQCRTINVTVAQGATKDSYDQGAKYLNWLADGNETGSLKPIAVAVLPNGKPWNLKGKSVAGSNGGMTNGEIVAIYDAFQLSENQELDGASGIFSDEQSTAINGISRIL